jgi:hypothetical protein
VSRACGGNWEKRNMYRLLIGEPEGMRPLGRSRCRWVDNIKMDVLGMGCTGIVWLRIGASGKLM